MPRLALLSLLASSLHCLGMVDPTMKATRSSSHLPERIRRSSLSQSVLAVPWKMTATTVLGLCAGRAARSATRGLQIEYLGYVTVHYHRIESLLKKVPHLWQAHSGLANSSLVASAPSAPTRDLPYIPDGERTRIRVPLKEQLARFFARALTATAASIGLIFGIRQGYMMKIAIPQIYWQRPGKIVAG
eukprot:scaffold296165_cov35-Tisochrysis_lutea.AAC.2